MKKNRSTQSCIAYDVSWYMKIEYVYRAKSNYNLLLINNFWVRLHLFDLNWTSSHLLLFRLHSFASIILSFSLDVLRLISYELLRNTPEKRKIKNKRNQKSQFLLPFFNEYPQLSLNNKIRLSMAYLEIRIYLMNDCIIKLRKKKHLKKIFFSFSGSFHSAMSQLLI